MRFFNLFFCNSMPQKYQNEKSPILNGPKKPKTLRKVQKITNKSEKFTRCLWRPCIDPMETIQSHIYTASLTIFQSYTHYNSYTLPILHSSNLIVFQSYTLPILHFSNLAFFQFILFQSHNFTNWLFTHFSHCRH